jgi:cytochrome c oxidase subunit 1
MGAFYFYWPKAFGYRLNETMGKWNFWLMLLGFNLTFGPMHILGLQGMSRRVYTYDANYGFDTWNKVATVGAFTLATSVAIFIFNIFYSRAKAKDLPNPGPDPWDARTIEWMIPSPVPTYNFDPIPTVTHLDEFWYRKYGETEDGRLVRIAATEDVAQPVHDANVHLPSPSYWPIVTAIALPIIGYGLIFSLWLCIPGGLIVVAGLYGWVTEHPDDPEAAHGHGPDEHASGDGHDADVALEAGDPAAGAADAGTDSEKEVTPVG